MDAVTEFVKGHPDTAGYTAEYYTVSTLYIVKRVYDTHDSCLSAVLLCISLTFVLCDKSLSILLRVPLMFLLPCLSFIFKYFVLSLNLIESFNTLLHVFLSFRCLAPQSADGLLGS